MISGTVVDQFEKLKLAKVAVKVIVGQLCAFCFCSSLEVAQTALHFSSE